MPAPDMRSRLDRDALREFRAALHQETRELSSLAGAAHIVIHRGRRAFACADGWADKRKGTPFGLKTLCRLHGATKPLISAAFLTLVDSGVCKLSDPVSKFLPLPGARASATPRLRDLLTMTAGFAYEDCPSYKPLMARVRRREIVDLASFCEALAALPLQARPGTRYEYAFCHDLLGRICEIISGKRVDRFMEEHLFKPLGMNDTHIVLPVAKRHRAAVLYDCSRVRKTQCRGLSKSTAARTAAGKPYRLQPYKHKYSAPGIMSCGGGILSYLDAGSWGTASDYSRFCQMLVDGGKASNGRLILQPKTVQTLWQDSLQELGRRTDGRLPGWHDSDGPPSSGSWWDHRGLSLLHAFLDFEASPRPPPKAGAVRRARRSSSMWMSGGGGAYWTIDAKEKLITVSMMQTFGGRSDERDGHGPLACRVAPSVHVVKANARTHSEIRTAAPKKRRTATP
eukprot:TRINITY_DN23049_c0_g1_i1.p1 TRINITY_DN23049_c0_g1~~TRINITY_DN23049_c0_g1_i1.p1  ORF type:complete len:485 (-),score=56.51 TRINITY_DN23049_c0_g1_i1:74-1438(-)